MKVWPDSLNLLKTSHVSPQGATQCPHPPVLTGPRGRRGSHPPFLERRGLGGGPAARAVE